MPLATTPQQKSNKYRHGHVTLKQRYSFNRLSRLSEILPKYDQMNNKEIWYVKVVKVNSHSATLKEL